ncbi:MAG: hypothetical protein ACK520_18710 [Inhella sp.]
MSRRPLTTVLRAAWRQPRTSEQLGLAGGVVGFAMASIGGDRGWLMNAQTVASLAVVLLAIHLLQGVLRQNHPHLARLMPGHRATLQWAVRSVLLLTAAALLGLGLAPTPEQRPVLALVAPVVLWLGGCWGLSRWMALPLLPLVTIGTFWLNTTTGQSKDFTFWASLACTWGVMLLALPALLRRGDSAHAAQWRALRSTDAIYGAALDGSKRGAGQLGQGWVARFVVWWFWPLRRRLDSARLPVRGAREALRRAQWVLVPSLHPTQQGLMLLTVGTPVLLMSLLPMLMKGLSQGLSLGVMTALAMGTITWLLLLTLCSGLTEHWRTRGEQALLRLAPHTPQGEALRLGWAATLRRHAVAGWVLHGGIGLGLCAWIAPAAWPHALAAVALVAPAVCLLPGVHWAHQAPPTGAWVGWSTAGSFLAAAVVGVPAAGGPALWPLVPLAWVTGGFVAWRWSRPPQPGGHRSPWPAGHAGPLTR